MFLKYVDPKRFLSILILSIVFSLNACCSKKNSAQQVTSNLIQACPEEWIQNKMPGPETSEIKEYFIYEGKRRELTEFNLAWIKTNCNIKPQIVH